MGACRPKSGLISSDADRQGNEHLQMSDLSRELQLPPIFEICLDVRYFGQSEGFVWLSTS